jgi:hypothetical protein
VEDRASGRIDLVAAVLAGIRGAALEAVKLGLLAALRAVGAIRVEPLPARAEVEGVGVGLGSSGEVAGLVSSVSALDCGVVLFEVPQPHVCLLGMAAVTVPQLHGFDAGCGHELSGRPGFRTGTMSRSLAWVHLVERWPRMQGSLRFA